MKQTQRRTIDHYHAGETSWPSSLATAEQAAEKIGIDPQRLIDLAEAGYAPHWRIDQGPPMFRMTEIKQWVAENLVERCDGQQLPVQLKVLSAPPLADPSQAPESIRYIDGLRDLPNGPPPGVYFLVEGDEVVYVGQSVNASVRVGTHANGKSFDRVFFVPVPRPHLDAVEGAAIRALRPRLNTGAGPTGASAGLTDAEALETYGLGDLQNRGDG